MATSFSRTLRSLRADRPRTYLVALMVGVVLLGGWGAWMMLARVAVYEATPTARLEVEQASHPVQAPVAGRVATSNIQLGRDVQAGEVLLELEGDAQRLELAEAKARLASIGPEIAAAKKELDAQEQAVVDDGQGVVANVAEAKAKVQEAEVGAAHAQEALDRAKKLRTDGLLSEQDLEKAKADLALKQAAAEAARMAVGRVGASGRADLSDRRARKESLGREIAFIEC
jgi:multidrug resistance efflux pump